jgi:Uma2 family endonuclease
MDVVPETDLLVRHPWVPRRKLTVADYYRMADAGILGRQERVELVEGELVQMPPIESPRAGTVNALNRLLVLGVGERAVVAVQNPIQLDDFNHPQPDFALLRPPTDAYRNATPRPDDVLLVIEVADSSLRYDRSVKLALYARHAIPEFWILDVKGRRVEVWRAPQDGRYTHSFVAGPGDVLESVMSQGLTVSLASLFD